MSAERNTSINGEPLTTLTFDGVAVGAADVVGEVGGGATVMAWITDRALSGLCATQAGVCEAALDHRHLPGAASRFGLPIATFQAVAHRMADSYIDTEAIRLTAYQAAWRLGAGMPAGEGSSPWPSSGRPGGRARGARRAAPARRHRRRPRLPGAPSGGPSTWSSPSPAEPRTCGASVRSSLQAEPQLAYIPGSQGG